MNNRKTVLIGALAVLAVLGGCSGVKEQIGLGRQSPDEFAVVKRAPLTLPPDYAALPEPGSEQSAAQEAADLKESVRSTVFGMQGEEKPKGSSEDALLSKMGASMARPDIRREINREQGIVADGDGFAEKLLFWKEPAKPEEPVVDPAAEKERLEQNEAAGKPVNEGDVPIIRKKQTAFDKLF